MLKPLLQLLIIFTALYLTACSQIAAKRNGQVTVVFPQEHRMHFSGKGAGAGVMLMSSMGPMGIAIGVAIDEGIAKDIAKAAASQKLNLEAVIKSAFSNQIQGDLIIEVERYGFVLSPSGGDLTWPQLHLKISGDLLTEAKFVKIPEDTISGCVLAEAELAQLKENGLLAAQGFESAARCGVLGFFNNVYR